MLAKMHQCCFDMVVDKGPHGDEGGHLETQISVCAHVGAAIYVSRLRYSDLRLIVMDGKKVSMIVHYLPLDRGQTSPVAGILTNKMSLNDSVEIMADDVTGLYGVACVTRATSSQAENSCCTRIVCA